MTGLRYQWLRHDQSPCLKPCESDDFFQAYPLQLSIFHRKSIIVDRPQRGHHAIVWTVRLFCTIQAPTFSTTFGFRKPVPMDCEVENLMTPLFDWSPETWYKNEQVNSFYYYTKFNFFQNIPFNFRFLIQNKLLQYKFTLKPVWTYGIQSWGASSADILTFDIY